MKRILLFCLALAVAACTPSPPPSPTELPPTATIPPATPTTQSATATRPAPTVAPPSPAPPSSTAPSTPLAAATTPGASRLFLPSIPKSDTLAIQPTPTLIPPINGAPPLAEAVGPDCAGLVTARDGQFWLNGQPWTFVGTNFSYLPDFPLAQAETSFATLAEHQVSVIRTWVMPNADLEHVAQVLDLGRKYNLRFIVTFDDYWHVQWGAELYDANYRATYEAHVRRVIDRFRDRPEVFMWQLMNEPTCGPEGVSEGCFVRMRGWAEAGATLVRSLDTCRPLSVGLIGMGGTLEREETHFRLMAQLPGVDTMTLHRHAFEDFNDKLKRELDVVKREHLPLVWGEIYERAYDKSCQTLSDDALKKRASLIKRDLGRSFDAGVDGYLLWQFAYGSLKRNGEVKYYCGEYDYERDDPVWDVFQKFKLPTN